MEKLDILCAILATTEDPESSNDLTNWGVLVTEKLEVLDDLINDEERVDIEVGSGEDNTLSDELNVALSGVVNGDLVTD